MNRIGAQPVRQTLQHHLPRVVSAGQVTAVGTLPPEQRLNFSIVLPLRNQGNLDRLLTRLYDRSSADYRQFLSVAQFTEQFGTTADDYRSVVSFAQAQGFVITGSPANRMVVPVRGTVNQINKAFHLTMKVYRHPREDRTFFSPDREPTLDLAVPVAHLTGLNNFSLPRALVKRPIAKLPASKLPVPTLPSFEQSTHSAQATDVSGSGPSGAYLASDMRTAYYGGTMLDGNGQAVGLFEFGGYDIGDVHLTFSTAGQSYAVPINNVLLDGATALPDGDDAEQVLDIVQAIGMAPGLSQVRVYIGTGTDDANILNSMASENIAKQLSCSWFWTPDDPATDDVFFKEFAAQGQSFFVASGDAGAYDPALDPYVYPAEDANVTAVGGTHLTTNGPGGIWASETAWNTEFNGSGGGISPDGIAIPSWQAGLATTVNQASATERNVPDVAMEADFDNYLCAGGNCAADYAGTSFAAPRWAGFTALINQQAVEAGTAPSGGIGFLNPAIYAIGKGEDYSKDFHDITVGNNDTFNQTTWYNAATGYDLVTGWGSAAGQNLIRDLAGKQVPGFWIGVAPSLSILAGKSVSTNITITGADGFTGNVSLAFASALPTGVTAAWSTNPATGMSVLTLTAGATAPAGTSTVTIVGTSGKLTSTAKISLAVEGPTFVLSTGYDYIEVNSGSSVTIPITLTPEYGFTGSATLSIAGLPSGVTASFSPNPVSGQSILTLTASATAPVSTSTLPLTITGTSGSLTVSIAIPFYVSQPGFLLFVPTPLSIGQGGSYGTGIYIGLENGFMGPVTLAIKGLPAGVAASFSPNPTTATFPQSNLTLTSSSKVALGNTPISIVGTSGKLTVSTPTTLTVLASAFAISGPGSVGIGLGQSTSVSVDVQPEYGFTGSVNLAVSGLPQGVTAVFSPDPATGFTMLTLSASKSASLGSVNATITGSAGKLTATTALTVGVFAPAFTITGPSNNYGSTSNPITMGQGTSSAYSIAVNPEYGFTGNVNLAVSGLPSGVTASISPNPATGATTLTLTANNAATVGTALVKITGTSGKLTYTTGFNLAVFAPAFQVEGPGSINLGQGTSNSFALNVVSQYGFSGNVKLSASGLPKGVTALFSPNPAAQNLTLTLTASSSATLGTTPVTITGTYGKLTSSYTFPLGIFVPTFTLTSDETANVGQGTSYAASIFINPEYGFTGYVNLAVLGLPAGVTATISPNPSSGDAQLILTASGAAKVGTYPLTITGTSGSTKLTAPLALAVFPQSFTVNGPGIATIGQGSTTTTDVYITPAYGFTGSVELALSGLPSGVTASISPNPTIGDAAIVLTAGSSALPGPHTLTVTGTSGKLSSSTTFVLTTYVPTFTLSPPASLSVGQGSSSYTGVNVNPQNGFTGSVNFTVSGLPAGVTASFSPNPSNGNSVLTVAASPSAAIGNKTLTITGVYGSLKVSTTVPLSIYAPAFTIQPPGGLILGQGTTTTTNLYINPEYGFIGSATLAVQGLPSGVSAVFSPNPTTSQSTLTVTASSKAAIGSSTVTIVGTCGEQVVKTTFPLSIVAPTFTLQGPGNMSVGQGNSTGSQIYVNSEYGFAGSVKLTVSGLQKGVTASFSPNPATGYSSLTLAASSEAAVGQQSLTITGTSGTQTASTTLTLSVLAPAFTLENPGSQTIVPGTSVASYIYVDSTNGFAGSVQLGISGLPSGVTAAFSPNPTTGQASLVLTAGPKAALGTATLTITGTSGAQTASTTLPVTVAGPSFSLYGNSSISLSQGTTITNSIYVNPANGFDGNVTLAIAGLPSGVTASFSPNSVSGTTSPSILTLNVSATAVLGSSTLTITGTSGALKATTTIALAIYAPSFTISANAYNSVPLGGSSGANIFINSNYNFTGAVQLSVSGLPRGVSGSFSPNPTVGGSSQLKLTASPSAAIGEYEITVIGTYGGLTSSATFPITVVAPSFSVYDQGPVNIGQGTSTTSYLYLSTQNGFTGSVNLSMTGLPAGVTASFAPNPTNSSTTLTLTASKTAKLGQYTATLTGTSGTQTSSSNFSIAVYAPSFTLYSGQAGNIPPGGSTTSYIGVNSAYGFTGNVSLAASGLPKGVSASFSPNPVSTGNTSNSLFTVVASTAAAAGQYNITLTGAGGGQTASTIYNLTIQPPALSVYAQGDLSLGQGSSTTTYVSIYAQSGYTQTGFMGNTKLAVTGLPSGVTAIFSPNPTSTGTSTLTLQAAANASLGAYNLTLTATSGTQTASSLIPITVYTPTFTISPPYSQVALGRGTNTAYSIGIGPEYGFAGNVKLALSGLPAGVTASFSPNPTSTGTSTLTLVASATAALGEYNVTLIGTSGTHTASAVFPLSVYIPTFTIDGPYEVTLGAGTSITAYAQIDPEYGFAANVKLSASGLPAGVTASFSPNPTSGDSTLTLTAGSNAVVGQYNVTINGVSGTQTSSTSFTLSVVTATFSLYAYGFDVYQGQSNSDTILISPQNGFDSPVSFSVSGLPKGVTASFSPDPSSTGSSTLTVAVGNSVPAGSYSLTVTGVSGKQSSSVLQPMTVLAPDPSIGPGRSPAD